MNHHTERDHRQIASWSALAATGATIGTLAHILWTTQAGQTGPWEILFAATAVPALCTTFGVGWLTLGSTMGPAGSARTWYGAAAAGPSRPSQPAPSPTPSTGHLTCWDSSDQPADAKTGRTRQPRHREHRPPLGGKAASEGLAPPRPPHRPDRLERRGTRQPGDPEHRKPGREQSPHHRGTPNEIPAWTTVQTDDHLVQEAGRTPPGRPVTSMTIEPATDPDSSMSPATDSPAGMPGRPSYRPPITHPPAG